MCIHETNRFYDFLLVEEMAHILPNTVIFFYFIVNRDVMVECLNINTIDQNLALYYKSVEGKAFPKTY